MGITVRHDQPADIIGLATAIGQGRSADRQAVEDESRTRFMLGLREQQKQFDVNTALKVRTQDIQQRQYNANLAAQDARQQQVAQNAELNRQAQLESQAMREEYDLYGQQQQQQYEYLTQAAKTVDEQVFDIEKTVMQMKLTPEGQRIRNEKLGSLRAIRESRGSSRPGVYANVMGQWLGDVNQTNLSAYEEKQPTRQEWYEANTYKDEWGNVIGEDRSGKPRVLAEAPPPQLSADEFAAHTYRSPDGSSYFMHPRINGGKPTSLNDAPTPKAEAKPKEVDNSKLRSDAIAALLSEHQLLPDEDASGSKKGKFVADPDAVIAKALELEAIDDAIKAAREKKAGGATSDGSSAPPATPEPVRVSSMEEASQVDVGGTFIFNGQAFLVTGPGEAEPL